MKITLTTAGALIHSMPAGKDVIEARHLTVDGLLKILVEKYGPVLEHELLQNDEIKTGLCMLVNGRNILSMPQRYRTSLKDGDEVFISVVIAGG